MATQYPIIFPGLPIAAGDIMAGFPSYVVKANTDTRTSTTTHSADSELTISLEASAVYDVEVHLAYIANTGGDIGCSWDAPSGATGNRFVLGPGESATATTNGDDSAMHDCVHGLATDVHYGFNRTSASQTYASERFIITTSTSAGDLTLTWAQGTSNATATQLCPGSFMKVTRIG